MSERSDWLTAADLAALRLPKLPVSERGIQLAAKRDNWAPSRKRAGRGGGQEYHISSLPEPARVALAAKRAAEHTCVFPGQAAKIGAALGATIALEAATNKELQRQKFAQALADFATLPEERQMEAKAKLALLQARDGFKQSAGIKAIVKASERFSALYNAGQINLPEWVTSYARRTGRLSVSWSSLNRWQKAYDANGLAGLVNGFKSTVTTTVPVDVQQFIQGLYTAHPHIKFKRVKDAIDARFDGRADLPSIHATRRYANKWCEENKGLLLYLANPDQWRNQQMFAFGNASEQITALNQLWEMDGTPSDVMLKDGRHTVVGCIDVWSRRAKLLVAPTSKATHVSALIRACMLDWGCPPPTRANRDPFEGIKTDNGSDYTSDHINMVLEALMINQAICPPFSPEKKPHIERFFQTFSHGIVELMPGYVGHSVADRKAIEARKSFAQRLMKKGGAPIPLEMTAEEYQHLCDRWLKAVYHQDIHAELGMSPADKARSWSGSIRTISDQRALDMLLLPADRMGTLQKKGIKHNHGWYISTEFARYDVGQAFRIHPDPADLGTIYVYHPNGYFVCAAQDPTRIGINRAEVANRAKAIQKVFMTEGAKALRKQAKKLGAEKAFAEILAHREGQISNVVELPCRAESYMTKGLKQAGFAADARQQQVLDPEKRRAERARQIAELQETGKLVAIPTDRRGRWRLYNELQRRAATGEALSERDTEWMVTYRRSRECQTFVEVEQELVARR